MSKEVFEAFITKKENKKKKEESNLFLLFRTFDHEKTPTKGEDYENKRIKFFLNQHEKLASKNPLYLKYKKDLKDRRPIVHMEAVLDDREWFGIKNNANDVVFKKERLSFTGIASENYPHVVQIQISPKMNKLVYEFVNKTIGQKFDSASIYVNMIAKHYLKMPFLAKYNPKDKWYCTKLILECLKYAKIAASGEIDSLTALTEDIYWWCWKKSKETKKEGKYPQFYVYPIGKFPTDLIL